MVSGFYFTSREDDLFLSSALLLQVSISTFVVSYIAAIPFYFFVERPTKNLLNYILFPTSKIFLKQNDLADESDEDDPDTIIRAHGVSTYTKNTASYS